MRSIIALTLAVAATSGTASAQSRAPTPAVNDASAHYRHEVVAAARRDVLPIRACYDLAPRSLWREIRALTLSLDPSGSVTDIALAPSSTSVSRIRSCLLPIVRTWRLSAPATHASVSITYALQEIRAAVVELTD
jgi:hypothetical protein